MSAKKLSDKRTKAAFFKSLKALQKRDPEAARRVAVAAMETILDAVERAGEEPTKH